MSDLISRKKLKEVIEPMVGKFEDDGSFWWSRESILRAIDSELVEADEPIQDELIKMAWCKGFSYGFAKAHEMISNYITARSISVVLIVDLENSEWESVYFKSIRLAIGMTNMKSI